ncbi:ORF3 [Torque teno mini virus 10]|uniref:ORF3 n=1 Tax=Torque teno mini virus 10 TaxID=2065036 RepID=A8DMQ6_9VIRU|nr:ORF3 [Torque teno mini virus 10]ABU55890.1 ORF3 [Torque teno mini virus 10]
MILVHSLPGIFPVTSMKEYKYRIQKQNHKQNSKNGTGEGTTLHPKLSKELVATRQLMKMYKFLQEPKETCQYADKHHQRTRARKRKKRRHHRPRSKSTSSNESNTNSSSESSSD